MITDNIAVPEANLKNGLPDTGYTSTHPVVVVAAADNANDVPSIHNAIWNTPYVPFGNVMVFPDTLACSGLEMTLGVGPKTDVGRRPEVITIDPLLVRLVTFDAMSGFFSSTS
jgi:hypothetical protein